MHNGNNLLFGGTNVIGNTGEDGSDNNIQPYITFYMYRKVS